MEQKSKSAYDKIQFESDSRCEWKARDKLHRFESDHWDKFRILSGLIYEQINFSFGSYRYLKMWLFQTNWYTERERKEHFKVLRFESKIKYLKCENKVDKKQEMFFSFGAAYHSNKTPKRSSFQWKWCLKKQFIVKQLPSSGEVQMGVGGGIDSYLKSRKWAI